MAYDNAGKATADYVIPDSALTGKGVSAQSNPMEKPEEEAKAVFDQISKEVIIPAFNEFVMHMAEQLGLIDLTKDEDKPVSADMRAALDDKVDKERRTGSANEYKVLSDNNLTDALKEALEANTTARHVHENKAFLDQLNQQMFDDKVDKAYRTDSDSEYKVLSDNNYSDGEREKVSLNAKARHSHENKTLLDSLTQEDINNWNGENVLTKDNQTEYIPTGLYHPATKKYVDEKVVAIGSADMTMAIYDPQGKETDIFRYTDDKVKGLSDALVMEFDNPLAWKDCTYSCIKTSEGAYTETYTMDEQVQATRESTKSEDGSWTEVYKRYTDGTLTESITVVSTKDGDGNWNISIT